MVQHLQVNQCDSLHSLKERQKSHDHFNRCRKSISQNSTSIYYKNSHKCGSKGNISPQIKGHLWWTHGQPNTQQWKDESLSAKFRNKTGMCILTISIQNNAGSSCYNNRTSSSNLAALLPSPSSPSSPHDRPTNPRDEGLRQGKWLFGEPADQEDGRLVPQNKHLIRVSRCQVLL